jgi:hypothetical protein
LQVNFIISNTGYRKPGTPVQRFMMTGNYGKTISFNKFNKHMASPVSSLFLIFLGKLEQHPRKE